MILRMARSLRHHPNSIAATDRPAAVSPIHCSGLRVHCSRARLRLAGEEMVEGAAAQYCQSDDRDQRTRAGKGSTGGNGAGQWACSAPSEAASEDPFGMWGDAALRGGEELKRPVTCTFWVGRDQFAPLLCLPCLFFLLSSKTSFHARLKKRKRKRKIQ